MIDILPHAHHFVQAPQENRLDTFELRLSRYNEFLRKCKMPAPNKNEIDVDPGTLLVIVFALLLLPLLFTGFLFQ